MATLSRRRGLVWPEHRRSVGMQFSPGRSGYFQRRIVVSSEQHEVLVKLIAQAH